MKKVAKQATEKGDISIWPFLAHVPMYNINDEKNNYLFVQSNLNIEAMLGDKNSWWNQVDTVLSSEEQSLVSALSSTHT